MKTVKVGFVVSGTIARDARDFLPFVEEMQRAALEYWRKYADDPANAPIDLEVIFGGHRLSAKK